MRLYATHISTPSAERPQPGAFAAQLQEACEGGSCDCSDDSLADSEDDEDIAEDQARQFTECRSAEADQTHTNVASATADAWFHASIG